MKISICNELFQGWPIEKVFEYVSRLGYDGVEIAPYTLADSVTEISPKRRKAIRHAAEQNGIEIVGLHWLLAKPEGLYINHPDEIIRIKTQEYMEALIHFCADIGGKILVHGSPHQRTVQEGWDLQESWDFAKETFKVCLKTAQQRNVLYCIEPLAHTHTNFINTVREAIQLVKESETSKFQNGLRLSMCIGSGEIGFGGPSPDLGFWIPTSCPCQRCQWKGTRLWPDRIHPDFERTGQEWL